MTLSNIRRLEIARRLINGEHRAEIALDLGITRTKVRTLGNQGIRICQLYVEPPITQHVSLTEAREQKDKFLAAIEFAIIGQYLK